MYKVKVFTANAQGKIEFTVEELQELLNEVARDMQEKTPETTSIPPVPTPETPNPYAPWRPAITWNWDENGRLAVADCQSCPYKPDLDKITVGDTPCTWCKKNTPTCATLTRTAMSQEYTIKMPQDTLDTTKPCMINEGAQDGN